MKKSIILLVIYFFCTLLICMIANAQIQQWATIYNGTANGNDHTTAMTIDANGNVYVTGWSINSSGDKNIVTLKYNNSGQQQWASVYSTANGDALPSDIKVDINGNVYVTGYTRSLFNWDDYATIKYDSNGNQQWIRTYNGPNNNNDHAAGLVLDANSNVYVTGYIRTNDGGYNYGTVKYDSNGNQLWDWQLNGTANSDDYGTAIAFDSNNYILVTGYSYEVSTSFDYLTTKYNLNSPSSPWPYPSTVSYDGGYTADIPNAITADANGNIYVTGKAGSNYATVKYNNSGNQQWSTIYNGTGNGTDNAVAVAVDGNGNVYVTGSATNNSGNTDYVTIKYSSSGNQQWVSIYNGSGNGNDAAAKISLDASGNIYVTGYSINNNGNQEYHTVKYDAGGNQQWDVAYNGSGNGNDNAVAIAVDGSGNVYVTGFAKNTNDDFVTIKYSQCAAISLNTASIPATCSSCCDGSATALAFGGSSPYTYNWSSGSSVNLCPGTYTVCVTDANGCSSCSTVNITFSTWIQSFSDEDEIMIYPNPSNGEFQIHLVRQQDGLSQSGAIGNWQLASSQKQGASIEIYNVLGEKLYSSIINNQSLIINLDVPNGIYFIKINTKEKPRILGVQKIIISR